MGQRKGSSQIHVERYRRASSRGAKYEKLLCETTLQRVTLEGGLVDYIFANLKNASSEMIRRLLHEFDSPASAFVLAAKLISLGVSEPNLWALLNHVHKLKYATHEKQPVSTSILIVPEGADVTNVGRLTSAPSDSLCMTEETDFLSFAEYADGFRSGIVVRSGGEVLGICSFNPGVTSTDCLLPVRYQAACGASASVSGLLFLFAGSGRVCIFQDGRRILPHRGTT